MGRPGAPSRCTPGELHFLAGWRRGRYAGHAVAVSVDWQPDLRFGANGTPADPLTDWAVLTLERPLAGPALRPMPFAGAAERDQVANGAKLARIGYGRDRPHLPVLVEPCRVLGWRGPAACCCTIATRPMAIPGRRS